ncbi:VOC family protein [Nocardiopsis ansamitocini]|uniref:Glyoxalase n=1 Tax=Nocardiopsis ansamitocini TaxID=1670832 RepID=A0A9W6P846_9ACTN|nr:VOC family protein [Nocardiopsis ansamitocini]GLU48763.1 glyoxalase [Nocardiopsis ansamitocini]
MIGRLSTVVLDCPDPRALARFYSKLLGLPIIGDEGVWVDIGDRQGVRISFQEAPDHEPPRWPDPAFPQQAHLDVLVDDIDAAEPKVLALGATRLPCSGERFRVYADPAGHPFCLEWGEQETAAG